MRRVFIVSVAVLCVVALSAFGVQSGTVPITLDVASMFSRLAYGAVSLVGAAVLWLGKRGLDSLNRVEEKVGQASQQLATISHELFGATGQNGMRSDVKEAKRLLHKHHKVIAVLADREGIDFNEDER